MPRTVLITGATSGLGLEMAKIYLAEGAKVWLTDLHAEAPASLSSLSGDWGYFQLDATSDQDWAGAAARVGSLDVLVSNAGIAVGGKIEKVSMETWQRALDINILGAVRAARNFVPLMNEGGRIAITASLAGLVHSPSMATYNTTKAACVALAETLDAELCHRGISVSAICPQFFKSGLADSLSGDDPDADAMARKLLSKTHLTSEVVARRSVKALERRRTVITPDGFALVNWYVKRFARPVHLRALKAMGGKLSR